MTTWRLATLAFSALGRGAARREAARRAVYHRRAQLEDALACHAAEQTLRGIAIDHDEACRADLGDAATSLESLAAVTTSLRNLEAPGRDPLRTDLEALDRALAEKRAEVGRGLEALARNVIKVR
ncbi:MAG TPA: hypothetical protein VEB43_05030 [Anaeromyxobacter sp.]|nr:hypothetical protein [Anaeromyxobacter sp.]